MGFGVLLIGYLVFFPMSIHQLGCLFGLVGALIMALALIQLQKYHAAFRPALGVTVLLFVLCVWETIALAGSHFVWNMPLLFDMERIAYVLETVKCLSYLLFHELLVYGIWMISIQVGEPKTKNAAVRNVFLVLVYYGLYFFTAIPTSFRESYLKAMTVPLILLMLVVYIFMVILIGSAYMRICAQGDEDMEQKPSRFAFINRMREKQIQRNQKAANESIEYRNERLKRRREKEERQKKEETRRK